MQLLLSNTLDDSNVINKTITDTITININLKRDVDISSPEIILLDGLGVNYSDFNYAQIPELGRYYFVDNVQRLNNKMIQLSLSCDVLETYKSEILNSTALFYRNIKQGDYYNADLNSSIYKTIVKYNSNNGLPDGESLILSTIGGAHNEL